jgi:hypothetical protein
MAILEDLDNQQLNNIYGAAAEELVLSGHAEVFPSLNGK